MDAQTAPNPHGFPGVDSLLGGAPPSLTLDPRPAEILPAAPALSPEAVCALAAAAPVPPPRRRLLEGLALLWHDHWDLAHAKAQEHEGQSDHDLLHAMGHRREGDYPNAEYWFRSAGRHPCLERMDAAVAAILPAGDSLRRELLPSGHWSPKAFVAAVRRHAGKTDDPAARETLVRVQALEFRVFAEWLLQG